MYKKILLFILLITSLFIVTGCVQKTGDAEPKRPTATEGLPFSALELEFYLPSSFLKSPNNGMLGVYEFYTGDLKDAGPTGIDVMILVKEIDKSFKTDEFINKDSMSVKDNVELKKVNINDYEWYKGKKNNKYYYCSTFRGHVYDIIIKENEDSDIYKDTIRMFENTLFFEQLEVN